MSSCPSVRMSVRLPECIDLLYELCQAFSFFFSFCFFFFFLFIFFFFLLYFFFLLPFFPVICFPLPSHRSITMQLWDLGLFSNTFIGSTRMDLRKIHKPCQSSREADFLPDEAKLKTMNLFKVKNAKGWWPCVREEVQYFSLKSFQTRALF